MAQPLDPYRTLGVKRDATEADVKAAHRRLAKRYHPDAGGGDRERFLKVQEAYRVLSDPLLRKDWDAKHAPGPIRADRQPAAPGQPRQRAPRRQPAAPSTQAARETGTDRAQPKPDDRPPAARPRSNRAYTWSAGEVPWWEEGATSNRRQPGRRRPSDAPSDTPSDASTDPDSTSQRPPPPDPSAQEPPNAFDVYNRSSGAAWSMAARAYFRRGEQELPRRGTFRYEGTQVLTGARARTAAENEARRRQAELRHQAAASTAQATPPTGTTAHQATFTSASPLGNRASTRQRRSAWPSIGQRLLLALVAWVPLAAFLAVAAPPGEEIAAQIVMAACLVGLFAAPRIAYIGAVAAIGLLVVGGAVIGAVSFAGVQLPPPIALISVVGAGVAVGYLAIAGLVVLGPRALRPWS
jgi:curved DNA-binding protein CbpA